VGDPFMEKLLLEACLEVMKTDALVGIQDMGAAGLTSSSCEMASRGGAGVEIEVSLVPQRESGMNAYEIMLSESQERMLLVVKRGREQDVDRVFAKWDLHAVRIGEVTTDGRVRIKERGTVVAEIPATALTDDAPKYKRPMAEPAYLKDAQRLSLAELGAPRPPAEIFARLLASPNVASKRWVYRQYDHMVRTNTLAMPGMGAGVVRIKGTDRALALATDCNSRFVYLDPYAGAQLAVAESARNVACAGGLPIGATNCLNFGNPQRPEIMWQFAKAVEGIGAACRALDIPITGGNVSLYNETDGKGVLPTPVLGMVGLIENAATTVSRAFRTADDVIVLLGESRAELGGSEYLHVLHGLIRGVPPALDLKREAALQKLLVEGAATGVIRSAHDCAEGGLAVTVAECCFETGLGAVIDLNSVSVEAADFAAVATLFSESASRVVVSVAASRVGELLALATAHGVPATRLGIVGGSAIRMAIDGMAVIDAPLADAEAIWATAIDQKLDAARAIA
jgi:phosphoribosylformylglycinamidine synthase II